MAVKTFKIEGELANKYHGCGAALAKIQLRFEGKRRFLDKLVDFDYLTPRTSDMTEDAGEIRGYQDANGNALAVDPERFMDGFEKIEGGVFALVVVNLSCYEACLA